MSENERNALEKLHTDASGVPGPDPASGKVWLNSADVVNRIIREFVHEALRDVRSPEFMQRLDFHCRRMNDIFMGSGQDDVYLKGPWNRADQIGEYVQLHLHIDGDTRLAVRDAFMLFSRDFLKLAHSSGGQFNETSHGEIDELIQRLRDALLGVSDVVTRA
jgi:hypothetical protein